MTGKIAQQKKVLADLADEFKAESSEQVVVVMVGASHDARDGDLRSVPAEVAKSLVDRRLARYADDGE